MRALVLGLGIIAAPAAAADQEPFEFQGAALDAEFSALSPKFEEADCRLEGEINVCAGSGERLFDSPASITYHFANYSGGLRLFRIDVIVLRGPAGSSLRAGLAAKWGKPGRYTLSGQVWERSPYRLSFDTLTTGAVATYENLTIASKVRSSKAARAASEL